MIGGLVGRANLHRGSGGGFAAYTQQFDSGSGSVVVPTGATSCLATLWGAGGGGGRSSANLSHGGGGGGYSQRTINVSADNGETMTWAVGSAGAGKTGDILVAAGQTYSALTAANLGFNLTTTAVAAGVRTLDTVFLSLTTGQGAAATADLYIGGYVLS